MTTDGRYAAAVTYAFQADFGKGRRSLLLVDLESGEVTTLDSVFAYWPYHHDTVLVSAQRLLVSAQYGAVGVWDLATGERLRTLDNDGSSIVAMTATHDGSGVIAAMGDRTLAGWKLSDGTLTFRSKPIEADFALLGSASGRGDLVSASTDGAIQLWGAVPTEPRAVFTADATIIDAQFTFDAERIVAVDATGHVHILRVARG